jgi:predicted ATP-grasp superfamily ATP-dependent carboligase
MTKNNIIIALAAFFVLCIVSVNGYQLTSELKTLKKTIGRVEIESIASSADAIYLPKRVCLVKVDETIDNQKLRKYLASCLHSHQKWLELNSAEPAPKE